MRILYDGMIYDMQSAGGVNRYFANIICRLPQNFQPWLITRQQRGVNYPVHPNLKITTYKSFTPGRFSYRIEKTLANCFSKVEESYLKNITVLNRFDVAHPTYYSLTTAQEITAYKCPLVLTVYDMINEFFPEQTDPSGKCAAEKRRAVTAAQAIICISENTKKDLLALYPLDEKKITVTHLASEIDVTQSYGPEQVPDQPYFLYVGSRASYKNFQTLLSAFAQVRSVRSNVALCVVGAPFNEMERRTIVELNLADFIEHYGVIDDHHLAKLYRCSVAFVYPSLYEGFGIPLLEAMACQTVVVASDSSSIPEVVDDAALLFNPLATDDLTDILLSLIEKPSIREQLISKGVKRANQFSWDQTVKRTMEVYASVAL